MNFFVDWVFSRMASVGPRRRLCVVGRFVGSAQNGPGGLPTKYGEIFKEVIVGIYRHKRFKAAIGVAMVALAVVIAVLVVGDSKVKVRRPWRGIPSVTLGASARV